MVKVVLLAASVFLALSLGAMALANSASMSVYDQYTSTWCTGGGYSYYYGLPAQGGTYVVSGEPCVREHLFWWHNTACACWYHDDYFTLSNSNISRSDWGSDSSAGQHRLLRNGFESSVYSTNSAW